MKVLVIGGNRFFGRKLSENLVRGGHDVWVLNRGSSPVQGSRTVVGDRRVEADLKKAFKESGANSKPFDIVYDQVCMSYQDADLAMKNLAPHAAHWVHTSTQSVYDGGFELKESHFEAASHRFEVSPELPPYPEAKRQAEARLAQAVERGELASLALMRIPIVLGLDDYTERLLWHVRRVINAEPMIVPNLSARLNFISSDDAARALYHLGFKTHENKRMKGPFNCASAEPIAVGEVIRWIERVVGRPAQFALESSLPAELEAKAFSPFGISSDWTMSMGKVESTGFRAEPLNTWLKPLIQKLSEMHSKIA